MDRITVRVTNDRILIDLQAPASLALQPELAELHASDTDVAAALDNAERDLQQLRANQERIQALEAALNRQQSRPRFDCLSATFAVLTGDAARDWVYVRDNVHQLVWARTCRASNPDGNGPAVRMSHEKAIEACAALGDGWRLPTRSELLTLVDDTVHEPATFAAFRDDTALSWYWTSTIAAWSSSAAWFVGFSDGNANGDARDYTCFVRAVRSVSAAPAGQ